MRRNWTLIRVIAFVLAFSQLSAAKEAAPTIKSGLQPGDKTFAFHVDDVTGPRKGNSLCYACAFGKHAVVNIQTTKFTNELVALIKQLDRMVEPAAKIKGDSRHAFVVYLTEDPETASKQLEAIAKKHELKNIPLTIYDELTGPKPYKISKDAEVTIMMWNDAKVASNHAFASAKIDKKSQASVLVAAKKLLSPAEKK